MKRHYARDANCIKKGKLLAQLALISTSSGNVESTTGNAILNNDRPTDLCQVNVPDGHPPKLSSTPLHSSIPSLVHHFGDVSPIPSADPPDEHLFDIDAEWDDGDESSQLFDGTGEDGNSCVSKDDAYPLPLFTASSATSPVSVDDFCCILGAYQRKNRVTDSAMDGFCRLIKQLLPAPNNCPASFGVVQRKIKELCKKEIGSVCSDIVRLCGSCHAPLDTRNRDEHICETTEFSKKPSAYFHCDIEMQLKLVIMRNGPAILKFLEGTSSFCSTSTAVRDIVSGEFYRKNVLPNPRGNELTLHLLINADGAKFTKSKAGSFWPVDAQIVELPPKLRVKFENAVLFALWQGDTKPEWSILMKTVIGQLRTLSRIGFLARIDQSDYYIRVRVLGTVFDLPACASIWNTVQWNGKYGCMHCKEPGVVFGLTRGNTRSNRRIWPYSETREPKDSVFWRTAYKEIQAGSSVPYLGVKGLSVLSELLIDPYLQNPLDFMHQAYEGVFDKILECLFGAGKPWTFGRLNHKRELDKFIAKIKFPLDFQRRIPPLDTLGYFKASEYKNLLLYGLLPALITFLLDHQVQDAQVIDFIHWVALYNEIAVRLNSDVIGLERMPFVDRLVSVWQQLLPDFLGEENQTYNCHATCHLTHFVRSLGPLHNYSTFAFESFNNVYAKMVTSAHGTLDQVARRFAQEKFIQSWQCAAMKNENLARIINGGFGKSSGPLTPGAKYGSVKLISKTDIMTLDDEEITALASAFGDRTTTVLSISCAKVGSVVLRTKTFESGKNVCTHAGKFFEGDSFFYAVIYKIFLRFDRVYILCKELRVIGSLLDTVPRCRNELLRALWDSEDFEPYGSMFQRVELLDAYRIVELENFRKRCLLIDFRDHFVLMEECMTFEHN